MSSPLPKHPLHFLQVWYLAQANGRWEGSHGITIESLDNPGWLVTIDLEGTPLEDQTMPSIRREASQRDWLVCEVVGKCFRGQGDPEKLLPILEIFQAWADSDRASAG